MYTPNEVLTLAQAFAGIVRSWLTPQQMQEVVRRNETPAYAVADAAHDFCDPNQAMLDAYAKVYNKEFDFDDEDASNLIDVAWSLAKKEMYFVDPMVKLIAISDVIIVTDQNI